MNIAPRARHRQTRYKLHTKYHLYKEFVPNICYKTESVTVLSYSHEPAQWLVYPQLVYVRNKDVEHYGNLSMWCRIFINVHQPHTFSLMAVAHWKPCLTNKIINYSSILVMEWCTTAALDKCDCIKTSIKYKMMRTFVNSHRFFINSCEILDDNISTWMNLSWKHGYSWLACTKLQWIRLTKYLHHINHGIWSRQILLSLPVVSSIGQIHLQFEDVYYNANAMNKGLGSYFVVLNYLVFNDW